jgi:hypothetical protein
VTVLQEELGDGNFALPTRHLNGGRGF